MSVNVSPLVHIEIVVRDAEGAYQFLKRVFNAKKVQEKISDFFSNNFDLKVVHVALGGVILQFIQPIAEFGSWSKQLKEKGPGVHNLTFLVDNLEETADMLNQEGAPVIFSGSIDWDEMIGSETVKSESLVYMLDTMEKLGFRLELSEKPPDEVLRLFGK